MVTLRPGQRIINIPSYGVQTSRRAVSAGGAADWWAVAGKTCVAAYQPKGAASYAASKVNLANPGTYDAANGTAYPTWDVANGWMVNGSQWLTTCNVTQISTVIFSFVKSGYYQAGGCGTQPNNMLILPHNDYGNQRQYWNGGKYKVVFASDASGVIALAGRQPYFNGIADAAEIEAGSGFDQQFFIGTLGGGILGFRGSIPNFAIYSDTLTGPEVATVSAAMAAL